MWLLTFFSIGVLFTPIHTANLTEALEIFEIDINDNEGKYKLLKKICPKLQFSPDLHELKWVVSMLDSWGKLPSGILAGHMSDLGSYDQCLQIDGSTKEGPFIGKYCANAINIYPKNSTGDPILPLPISMASCMPSTCSFEEFELEGVFFTNNKLCQTRESFKSFDTGDWVVSVLLVTIVVIMILQTCYDIYLYNTESKTKHDIFIAFSLLTNGRKLMTNNNSPKIMHCLNGMRVISMAWVIGGHRYTLYRYAPLVNSLTAVQWEKGNRSFYVHGGHVAVDTFFFMSALLISYGYFLTVNKKQMKFIDIPLYYLHRIIRIMPAVAATYAVTVTVNRHIYDGPLWGALIQSTRDTCIKWWWSYFLFVQNYVNYKEMCILPTWYLSGDMQMFWFTPFVIIPMGRLLASGRRKLAYVLITGLTLLGVVIPMIIDLFRENDNEFETHTRISVYTLGIFLGLFLSEYRDKKINISNSVNLLLWGICLPGMLAIIVTMGDIYTHPDFLKTNLFFTFSRPAWAIGLSWVIFACVTGRGGIVNWFLSRPVFELVGRLTFSMYLVHMPLLTLYMGSTRTSEFFSEYHVIYHFCGDLIFSYFAAIIWVLTFESPMVMIEKIIFGRGKGKQPEIKKTEVPNLETSKKEEDHTPAEKY